MSASEKTYLAVRKEAIDRLFENAAHGTRREDIEAAYLEGVSEGIARQLEGSALAIALGGAFMRMPATSSQ